MSDDSSEKVPQTMLEELRVLGIMGRSTEKAVDVIEALAAAVDSEKHNTRVMAISWLGDMGERAVPHLIKALRHEDSSVRTNAANALGKIGKKAIDAVPELIKLLGDKDKDVRHGAIEALGEIGEKERSVPALVSMFDDEDGYNAVYALVRYGADKDIMRFLLMVFEGAPKARTYIAETFIRIGPDALLPLHKGALEHPELRPELQLIIGEIKLKTNRPSGVRQVSEKPKDLSQVRSRALDIGQQKERITS